MRRSLCRSGANMGLLVSCLTLSCPSVRPKQSSFTRAIELHGPLDSYVEVKLDEHRVAAARRGRRHPRVAEQQPRLFIREGGLTGRDWATITEYTKLLEPFAEATRLLE